MTRYEKQAALALSDLLPKVDALDSVETEILESTRERAKTFLISAHAEAIFQNVTPLFPAIKASADGRLHIVYRSTGKPVRSATIVVTHGEDDSRVGVISREFKSVQSFGFYDPPKAVETVLWVMRQV